MGTSHPASTNGVASGVQRPVRLLISEAAADEYGDQVLSVDAPIEFVVMRHDESVSGPDGRSLSAEDSNLDVAWASADLFTQGGPGAAFVRYATGCPTLSWFHSPAAGTDNPRFRELIERGVCITNTHQQSVPIAEYVMRAVLEHFQGAAEWREAQARREWRWRVFRELEGTTWLIVGFGAIGADVAKRAAAFDVRVIGVRRNPTGEEAVDELVHPDQMLDHVSRADVIVLAAPSTPATQHLVNAEFLSRVRPEALLVNVSRGALVDETALLESLDRGVPAAVVLDVTEVEPLPQDSPLWAHPRVTITPHNSSLGDRTPRRRAAFFVDNLRRFVAGEQLASEVTFAHIAGHSKDSARSQERPAAVGLPSSSLKARP